MFLLSCWIRHLRATQKLATFLQRQLLYQYLKGNKPLYFVVVALFSLCATCGWCIITQRFVFVVGTYAWIWEVSVFAQAWRRRLGLCCCDGGDIDEGASYVVCVSGLMTQPGCRLNFPYRPVFGAQSVIRDCCICVMKWTAQPLLCLVIFECVSASVVCLVLGMLCVSWRMCIYIVWAWRIDVFQYLECWTLS